MFLFKCDPNIHALMKVLVDMHACLMQNTCLIQTNIHANLQTFTQNFIVFFSTKNEINYCNFKNITT